MASEMLPWVLAGVLATLLCFMYYSNQKNYISTSIRAEPRAAFRTTRLTQSTFLLSEYNDVYDEQPQIFVKIVPAANAILIIDTGCGGATVNPDIEITSLRRYIEDVKLECNDGKPLNEGGRMEYVVVATHCHYDHILGIEQFAADSLILASSHSPSFLSRANLPTNSLCASMGLKTPVYTPILVPHRYAVLGVSVLHTPGHTPDEVALYDAAEKMLYVGDSVYETATIIFPKEGSIVAWMASMQYLIDLVQAENDGDDEFRGGGGEVLINCGHETVSRPALAVLKGAIGFMEDVIGGREPVRECLCVRGEANVRYVQEGGQFALRCPERLVLQARGIREV
ncbi:Metallo-hydrolase/oxidoreductase [Mycena alexandri]|uniref:Metallo-hydrolase/oxidoreductase n=1 Tax=Mycena alexandri TaxID=1745969 RepID=A0AAD6SVU6_9AGAR|nr:Metallo-hydrolase/oxidoreductase [Mycena alexandri]